VDEDIELPKIADHLIDATAAVFRFAQVGIEKTEVEATGAELKVWVLAGASP
jgi:hypothetical protein